MDLISSRYEPRGDTGVNEAILRRVIVAFYERVKRDDRLGPVFAAIVGNDWDAHVEKVCSFWLYVTRLKSGYGSRDFMPAHLKHPAIQASLLPQWLHLFRQTANELCAGQVADLLIDIAKRMAVSIEMSLSRRDADSDVSDSNQRSRQRRHRANRNHP